ncbi:MAG: cyclodeaminase/cyclohydrolase family protein [Chloroflexota bacterium]
MTSGLTSITVRELLDRVASADPTPGGGSVAALTGALAAGLVSMVCRLTVGRERYAAYQAEAEAVLSEAERLREGLSVLINRDAAAFEGVMQAMRLPRGTEEERAQRSRRIQEATRAAALVPLEIARRGAEIRGLCNRIEGKSNPNAASDVIVARALCDAALISAIANVEINLGALDDAEWVAMVRAELVSLRPQ